MTTTRININITDAMAMPHLGSVVMTTYKMIDITQAIAHAMKHGICKIPIPTPTSFLTEHQQVLMHQRSTNNPIEEREESDPANTASKESSEDESSDEEAKGVVVFKIDNVSERKLLISYEGDTEMDQAIFRKYYMEIIYVK